MNTHEPLPIEPLHTEIDAHAVSSLTGTVRIGVNYNMLQYASLEVYEIIIYKKGLTIAERANVVAYLSYQYGLSTN